MFIGPYAFISMLKTTWRQSALLISTLVYSAFVVFRTAAYIFEGLSSMSILIAYIVETVSALVGIFLMKTRSERLQYTR